MNNVRFLFCCQDWYVASQPLYVFTLKRPNKGHKVFMTRWAQTSRHDIKRLQSHKNQPNFAVDYKVWPCSLKPLLTKYLASKLNRPLKAIKPLCLWDLYTSENTTKAVYPWKPTKLSRKTIFVLLGYMKVILDENHFEVATASNDFFI